MKRITALMGLILFCGAGWSQVGKHGDLVVTASNTVLNSYTRLTQDAANGDIVLHVNDATMTGGMFATPLEPGDMLMIIQVQGATILGNVNNMTWGGILSYNNCGNHEFAEVLSVQGNTIGLSCPLENDYTESGRVVVVRVPRLNSLTVQNGASVTGTPWDGNIGGAIALEVLSFVDVQAGGQINATGIGLRGGFVDNAAGYNATAFASNAQNEGGAKGESIAGFGPEYAPLGGRFGRGAPANGGGGGNAHNAGGGGGCNAGQTDNWNGNGNPQSTNAGWTAAWNLEAPGFAGNTSAGGGRGGYTFSMGNQDALTLGPGAGAWNGDQRRNVGGLGGRPLQSQTGRIFYGGGGGAGDGNNGAGTDGADGGGLINIRCYGTIGGNGSVIANGQNAPVTPAGGNDAPGGGGGGGAIILNAMGGVTGLDLIAEGGQGGDQNIGSNEAEGPGGGGGGGFIAINLGAANSMSVVGGMNGQTNSAALTEFPPNGATAGGPGIIATDFLYAVLNTVTALDDTVCPGESSTLTALLSGALPSGGQVMWYDQPAGGNVIATGNSLTLGPLFTDTTVYVGICPGGYRDTVHVVVEDLPIFSLGASGTSCNAFYDGSAWVQNVVTAAGYTVTWNTNPVQTGDTLNNLWAGTYQAVVTSSNGCADSAQVVVTEPDLLTTQVTSLVDAQCNLGSASIQAHGGVPPYTYLWWPSGSTTNSASGLAPGTHVVQVTDSNGCSVLTNIDIDLIPDVELSYTATDVVCYGQADGTVDLDILGGMAPYTVDFGLGFSTDTAISGVPAGIYQAQVVDAMGCMDQITVNVLTPAPLTAQLIQNQPAFCGLDNGVAEVAGVGGIPGYTYDWTTGAASALVNLLAGGGYNVTITDANGCTYDTVVTINVVPELTLTPLPVNPTCYGYSDGVAEVGITQGVAPYQIQWGNGATSAIVNGLPQGTYSVQVQDSMGCVKNQDVVLVQPAQLAATTSSVDTYCDLAQGEVSVTNVTGGTAPYSYQWSTGSTNTTVQNLPSGAYQLLITDANACQDSVLVVVSDQSGMTLATQQQDVTCYGWNDGQASVVVGGNGQPPYSYLWSNGVTNTVNNNLTAGNYTISVTDALGCTAISIVSIDQPDTLMILPTVSHVLCSGGNSGEIDLATSGGVPAYNITLNGIPGNGTYTGLGAGAYQAQVMDAHGCVTSMNLTVTQPLPLGMTFSSTDVSCYGFGDGVVEVFASGGTTPYAYDWQSVNATSSIVNGVTPGTYAVTVTDANDCVLTGDTIVVQPDSITLSEISHVDITCYGTADGQVEVQATGGVGGYGIAWTPSGATTFALGGLAPGSYAGVVTDANGCQSTMVSHIVQPDSLIIDNLLTSPATCNMTNGGVFVQHSGGTGPFNYSWSPNVSNTFVAMGLAGGAYDVVVTDAHGCLASGTATVDAFGPPTLAAVSTPVSCDGGFDGSVTIEAQGGTAPYVYQWNGVPLPMTYYPGLTSGMYGYAVIDANGCYVSDSVYVDQLPTLTMSAVAMSGPSCSYNQDGSATVQVQGGTAPYDVIWNGDYNLTGFSQSGLAAGMQQVQVEDANGCMADTTLMLDLPGELVANGFVLSSVTCFNGNDGSAAVNVTGGNPAYSYNWNSNPVQTGQTATGLLAGTYQIIVTDANGCLDTTEVTLLENLPVVLDLAADTMICPGEVLNIQGFASGGSVSGLTYHWTDDLGMDLYGATQALTPDTTHWVFLDVTDPNCPGANDSILVHVAHIYQSELAVQAMPDSVCPGSEALVAANCTTPYGPVAYSWTGLQASGAGPYSVFPNQTTSYVVSVQNHCGIPVTDTVSVFVYPEPQMFVSASDTAGCPEFNTTLSYSTNYPWGVSDVVWTVDGLSSAGNDVELTLTSEGVYMVSMSVSTGAGCYFELEDVLQLEVYPQPEAHVIYSPAEPMELDLVTFNDVSVNGDQNYWFINGAAVGSGESHSHIFAESGDHLVLNVVHSEHGCVDTAFVTVPVRPVLQVFVPNAFTPDEDSYNNYFFPVISGVELERYQFMVFDRWGELIFETEDLYDKWDGRFKGRMVKDDVYVWKLKAKDYAGEDHEFYGHVTVVR